MSYWFFEPRSPLGVYNAPKHDEHFSHQQGIVASLVRETTQNSGDASDPSTNKPVRMRFRFGKIEADRFGRYLKGLDLHLENYPDLKKLVADNKAVKYLAIEDFETHGLRGSSDPLSKAIDSSYIAFWHRYGESGKAREHGGRHGLGKSTIASASGLRLFFGATVPSDVKPRQILLQGQICLSPHNAVDDKGKPVVYDAYGLWYNKVSDSNFTPFIGKAAAAFVHDFNLERGQEPGLSLIVPFPDDDLTPEAIVKATIVNCFHQILNGHLVVEVEKIPINASTLKGLATRHGLDFLKAAIGLSEEAAKGKLPIVALRPDATKGRLREGDFNEATLKQIRKRWTDGDTVAVKLPVTIRERKSPTATIGDVQLYVRREQDESLSRETYVRGRVTVPLNRNNDKANWVGLLVADQGIASTFLGDSEPPAHNRWYVSRLKDAYVKPEEALNRIRFALRDLLSILDTGDDEHAIVDAFSDYLWAAKPEDIEEDRLEEKKTTNKDKAVFDKPKPQRHALRRVEGGFVYSYQQHDGDESEEEEFFASARIYVSYSRRASPKKALKKAKFSDFDDEMEMRHVGDGKAGQQVQPRRIVFTLDDIAPGYELFVTGFDPNRDIELQLEAQDS